MHVQINGERREISDSESVADLVLQLGLAGRRIAIEINEQIVPASEHARHVLHPGDRVEIVQAIGGG